MIEKNLTHETIMFRLDSELKRELNKMALKRGLNLSSLIRMWLIDRLKKEQEDDRIMRLPRSGGSK